MSTKKPRRRQVDKRQETAVEPRHVRVEDHASEITVARSRSGPLPPRRDHEIAEKTDPTAVEPGRLDTSPPVGRQDG